MSEERPTTAQKYATFVEWALKFCGYESIPKDEPGVVPDLTPLDQAIDSAMDSIIEWREAATKDTDTPARQITTVGGIECWGFQGRRPSHLYSAGIRLAKCPFCGDEAGFTKDIRRAPPEFPYAVECSQTSCGIRTPFHYRTEEAAAEAWNRRTSNRGGEP